MKYNSDIHHRRSIRLAGYDYSQSGAYFVTICTQNRECLFGDIAAGEMWLNDAGCMVKQCWNDIPAHFPYVELDEFIIMPNHVHGIIVIADIVDANVGAKNLSPLRLEPNAYQFQSPSKTIGSIVRGFKIGATKWFRQKTDIFVVWQRNYYEHIIRNEQSLQKIRQYIIDNPAKWADDENNPANIIHRRGDSECRGEKFFAPTKTFPTNTPCPTNP